MSKNSSAMYYQENKERLQKKELVKNINFFFKEKKEKENITVVDHTKVY